MRVYCLSTRVCCSGEQCSRSQAHLTSFSSNASPLLIRGVLEGYTHSPKRCQHETVHYRVPHQRARHAKRLVHTLLGRERRLLLVVKGELVCRTAQQQQTQPTHVTNPHRDPARETRSAQCSDTHTHRYARRVRPFSKYVSVCFIQLASSRSLKSSRACAPRDSFRASAAIIVADACQWSHGTVHVRITTQRLHT